MNVIRCATTQLNSVFLLLLLTMANTNDDGDIRTMDLKTPRNVHLSAFYRRSFAFHTVKNRMPVILTSLIDTLARTKEDIGNEYGEEGTEDLKAVIGDLSKLKYEVQTNKPLENLTSDAPDSAFYNSYLASQAGDEGNITYFSSIWLLSECYMYRKIRQAFEHTTKLKNYDPFLKQKQTSYTQALPIITQLGQYLTDVLYKSGKANEEDFVQLLKLNLWGNKCDLSLSNGVVDARHDHLFNLENLEPNILCDQSQKIWKSISNPKSNSSIVDIVFDNAGYEVFTDLCLADYLITTGLAEKVRFYVKTIPWFISDVMTHDFHWTLEQLKNSPHCVLRKLGEKWAKYVADEAWVLVESSFWTLPLDYSHMAKVDGSLYKQLAEAKLVIFKGDLNYRKLFGEKNWDPVTPVDVGLQGFFPTKLCTLRTIKADIVCGLAPGVAEKTEAVDEKWMETGNYGLIQFCDKVVSVE